MVLVIIVIIILIRTLMADENISNGDMNNSGSVENLESINYKARWDFFLGYNRIPSGMINNKKKV